MICVNLLVVYIESLLFSLHKLTVNAALLPLRLRSHRFVSETKFCALLGTLLSFHIPTGTFAVSKKTSPAFFSQTSLSRQVIQIDKFTEFGILLIIMFMTSHFANRDQPNLAEATQISGILWL